MTHLTSAILAGLGAVFGVAGLLFYWASGRAFERAVERAYDDPRSSDPFGDATRGSGSCALLFIALGLGACAVACLVAGGIVFLMGH
jgi:hypothetical protein